MDQPFTLQPPPLPEPSADKGRQLTDWHELEGKTIRYVFSDPAGPRGHQISAVLIFEDESWSILFADSDGSDGSNFVMLGRYYWTKSPKGIADYLSPHQLLEANLINTAQHRHLIAEQEKTKTADKARRAASLRAELAMLEQKPAP
jgi:hypothetical protein